MREGVELAAEDGDGLGVHRFVGGVDDHPAPFVGAAAQRLVVAAAAGAQPARAIARREAALRAVARVAKIAELGAQRPSTRRDGVEQADRRPTPR